MRISTPFAYGENIGNLSKRISRKPLIHLATKTSEIPFRIYTVLKPLRKSARPSAPILPKRTRFDGPQRSSLPYRLPDILRAARKDMRQKAACPFLPLPTKNLLSSRLSTPHRKYKPALCLLTILKSRNLRIEKDNRPYRRLVGGLEGT